MLYHNHSIGINSFPLFYPPADAQSAGCGSPEREDSVEQAVHTPDSGISLLFEEPTGPLGFPNQGLFVLHDHLHGAAVFAPQSHDLDLGQNSMIFDNGWVNSANDYSPISTDSVSEDEMIISRWDERQNNAHLEKLTQENEIKWGEKEFGCRQCNDNKVYPLRSLLKKHVKCHASPRFACAHRDCARVYSNRSEGWTRKKDAIRHFKSKHLPGEFVCDYSGCHKRFSRKDNFNDHQSRRGHG